MNRLKPCVLVLIFFFSCTNPPENIIPEDQMIRILADVHLANSFAASYGNLDTIKQKTATYLNAVYKKHHIDSVKFNRSLQYYSKNPTLLNELYGKVEKGLQRKEDSIIKAEELERKRLAEELKRRQRITRDSILRIKNKNSKKDTITMKPVVPALWAPFKDYYFVRKDSVRRDSVKVNRSTNKK